MCNCPDARNARRIIVVLCLLGLYVIAGLFIHNDLLAGATALAVGSPMGDLL